MHVLQLSHVAPELLRFGKVSQAADVYSFGITMWELLTGQPPYQSMQFGFLYEQVAIHGMRPAVPEDTPEGYQLLMQSCWHQDPQQRPSFEQVGAAWTCLVACGCGLCGVHILHASCKQLQLLGQAAAVSMQLEAPSQADAA